jgi:hypothetical protein
VHYRDVFYAALAVLLLGWAIHDLRAGKVTLSFATYDRSDRPVAFFVSNAFAILCATVLFVILVAKWFHITWLFNALH